MNFILMLAIWRLKYRTIKNSSTVSGVGDPCIFVYARQKLKKIRTERRLSWIFLVEISENFRKCCIHRMKSRNWNMTSVGLVRFFVECLHDSQSCIQAMSDVF